jgi:hypothetical protein
MAERPQNGEPSRETRPKLHLAPCNKPVAGIFVRRRPSAPQFALAHHPADLAQRHDPDNNLLQ